MCLSDFVESKRECGVLSSELGERCVRNHHKWCCFVITCFYKLIDWLLLKHQWYVVRMLSGIRTRVVIGTVSWPLDGDGLGLGCNKYVVRL